MKDYFQLRRKSFAYAWQGLRTFWRTQAHAKIHVLAAVSVTGLAAYLRVERWEWCTLIVCITLVLAAEAFNTAIEFLTDLASPDYHPLAGKAKDVAAGAVLLTATGALIIGMIIFLPYLLA